MDKEMLAELRAIFKEELEPIKSEIKDINNKVDRIEKNLNGVHDQTADLTEFRTEMKEGIEAIRKDISKLTNVTKTNCFDIAELKAVK